MGRGTVIRLPYIQPIRDGKTGATYHYFRKAGCPRFRLPGIVGSAEFMEAYKAALAERPFEIAAKRTKPGSFSALCVSYYNSARFKSYSANTQRNRRRILEKFRLENADKSAVTLSRKDVQRMVDNRASPKPTVAKDFLKALRSLMTHAVSVELIEHNPCDGVRGPIIRSRGHHTWTEQEIAQFEQRWPVGTKARLALALLLYTCQRKGDCIVMGRQHVGPNGMRVKQEKTGTELLIPMHTELVRAIDEMPTKHLTFLVTEYGKPYSSAGFGNAMRDWCNSAGLAHCAAHGLRKAACRRLAEAGCSASQIRAMSGHRSLKELETYVKAAEQQRMAVDAMQKIKPGMN